MTSQIDKPLKRGPGVLICSRPHELLERAAALKRRDKPWMDEMAAIHSARYAAWLGASPERWALSTKHWTPPMSESAVSRLRHLTVTPA